MFAALKKNSMRIAFFPTNKYTGDAKNKEA